MTVPELGRCICKLPRPETGEDWSEVVAAELADRLGIPHAEYVLAQYQGQRAVVTPSFVSEDGTLILGNQLLVTFDSNYDLGAARFHQSAHTISAVLRLLEQLRSVGLPEGWEPPASITLPAEVFVGYLTLDALIGNTDRHHQNWGLVAGLKPNSNFVRLAPTFDHASSLGCHLQDATKVERLKSTDPNYTCRTFAAKAPSAFFHNMGDRKPLGTLDAFIEAARVHPAASRYWLGRVDGLAPLDLAILLSEVPTDRLSNASLEFALELMTVNRDKLLGVLETL